ncbi:MAG: ribosomal protein S18-alanine N-acetyltransferase [Eubacteriales bacterium]|nr:ribosomal protein S18-alanine N-acetyltransferase [Eubacteriales bacterium]
MQEGKALEVTISPTTIAHIDQIMILENLCFTIPWSKRAFIEELTRNKFAEYHSAIVDGKVVGYVGMWKVIDEGHITNIAVHPGYRRNHIASALLEKIIESCQNSGLTAITLEVRESNIPARSLYEKYGFKVEGRRKRYYSDNDEDALIMWYYEKVTS